MGRGHLARRLLIVLLLLWTTALPAGAQSAAGVVPPADVGPDFVPVWVLVLTPTELWTAPRGTAVSQGSIAVHTPLRVLAPQEGGRLYIYNTASQRIGWVDAPAVAPIPEPTEEEIAAYLAPPPFEPWWAMPYRATTAWSGPEADATAVGSLRQWLYLQVVGPEENGRFPTIDPRSETRAYVAAVDIGPVGPPPPEALAPPPPDTEALELPGRIVGNPMHYDRPQRADHFSLGRLPLNRAVTVQGLVDLGEGGRWYRIGAAEFVPETSVRVPRRPDRTFSGRWIDANLTEPVLLTAYEGDRPVYATLAVKGTQAFQTPTGLYRIQRRVENETMDSRTIGIPRDAPGGYYLQNVRYTQYFTGDGAAIHYNYWRSDWGFAGSHGCLGVDLDAARFFWDFASVGTVLYIHY